MRVIILSKEKVIFDGYVKSVSSYNDIGAFDVLENHANFITMISSEVVLDKHLKSEKKFSVTEGVLSVSDERVEVFV